ncbi:hypothetical protein [Streptomyces sp. NPDC058382]|uniref:hypothetical protein n=1 Tax=unclassified Streptomyces TaxID=2593676 RepID=UPI00362EFCF1
MPFFRWVLTLGVLLIGCSAAVYVTVPDMPELRQVDLSVLEEAPDGACTVQWNDPFDHHEHEAPYRCDADRDPILKAPAYDPESGHGWETGFVVAEGSDKGELYSLGEDDDEAADRTDLSDRLVIIGLLLTITGLLGGNIRAASRLSGVQPHLIRRAHRLSERASSVARDHSRAVDAVRQAWTPLHRERVREELTRIPVSRLRSEDKRRFRTKEWEKAGIRTVRDVLDTGVWELGQLPGVGRRTAERAVGAAQRTARATSENVVLRIAADRPEPRTTALIAALHVLMAAGPGARQATETAKELAAELDVLLPEASAASGYARMLRTGPEQRRRARSAVGRLRKILDEAERNCVDQRFGQASVDLLRGPDSARDGLSAWADFESRTKDYYRLLAEITADRDTGIPLRTQY